MTNEQFAQILKLFKVALCGIGYILADLATKHKDETAYNAYMKQINELGL